MTARRHGLVAVAALACALGAAIDVRAEQATPEELAGIARVAEKRLDEWRFAEGRAGVADLVRLAPGAAQTLYLEGTRASSRATTRARCRSWRRRRPPGRTTRAPSTRASCARWPPRRATPSRITRRSASGTSSSATRPSTACSCPTRARPSRRPIARCTRTSASRPSCPSASSCTAARPTSRPSPRSPSPRSRARGRSRCASGAASW